MGISIRAYARHRGVTDTAVHKAIRTGRISTEPDGTLDADRADQEWARNTDAPNSGTAQRTVKVKVRQEGRPAGGPSGGPGSDAGTALPSGGTSLLQARTVNEVLKAQLNKVSLAEKRKELVDRAQAVAHVFKLARVERDAWLNWPARVSAQIAIKVQADPHLLHMALEAAVRDQLQELGEMRPRVD